MHHPFGAIESSSDSESDQSRFHVFFGAGLCKWTHHGPGRQSGKWLRPWGIRESPISDVNPGATPPQKALVALLLLHLARIPKNSGWRRMTNFANAAKCQCRLHQYLPRCLLPETSRASFVSLRMVGPRKTLVSLWGIPHVVPQAPLSPLIFSTFRPVKYLRPVSPTIRRQLPSIHVGREQPPGVIFVFLVRTVDSKPRDCSRIMRRGAPPGALFKLKAISFRSREFVWEARVREGSEGSDEAQCIRGFGGCTVHSEGSGSRGFGGFGGFGFARIRLSHSAGREGSDEATLVESPRRPLFARLVFVRLRRRSRRLARSNAPSFEIPTAARIAQKARYPARRTNPHPGLPDRKCQRD